jgi:hypothetical protein
MSAKIEILVQAADPADAAIVTAFLNVAFRKFGMVPVVKTRDMLKIMQLGADDLGIGQTLHATITEDGASVTLSDGTVEAFEAAEAEKNRIVLAGRPVNDEELK